MKRFGILIMIFCAGLIMACNDIFEVDISGDNVEVITPPDSQVINGTSVVFWWDYLDGADDYEVQIVTPAFKVVEKLVADTTIQTNKFRIVLEAGSYQWRIRACNSVYCTDFICRELFVTVE